jgi:hypothetical protein
VIFLLGIVEGLATLRGWPGLVEVSTKHGTLLEGVLDGHLMIGARLLKHLVEEVGTSGRFPRVLVLGDGDKIHVGGVAFRLRVTPGFGRQTECELCTCQDQNSRTQRLHK